MTPWEYQISKMISVLQKSPDGTEVILSVGGRFMIMARQGYALVTTKGILSFVLTAMKQIAEKRDCYQPVIPKLEAIITSIEECAKAFDEADKINKLRETSGVETTPKADAAA